MKTDRGKIIHRQLISGPLFQSEKRNRSETVPAVSAEITPKNRPERTGWQVREVGRDPTRHCERQATNQPKQEANRD